MRKADNLPPYCAVVKNSRSLNFLNPSGPPMACYGSALPALCYALMSKYSPLEEEDLCSIYGTNIKMIVGHKTSLYCTIKCRYEFHENETVTTLMTNVK